MIQLSYQPALDPFHAMFRLLRIREVIGALSIESEKARILDFYLLFPFRIGDIRLRPAHRSYKRLGKYYVATEPYGDHPDDKTIFNRMEPMQSAAFQTLASHELIDHEQFLLGRLMPTATQIPNEIAKKIEERKSSEEDLLEFLLVLARDYELLGPNGLKARTGLLDFRHDAI